MIRGRTSHGRVQLRVDGTPLEAPSFTATVAKNEFGHVLNLVAEARAVVITKHDTPTAVIVSYPQFQALTQASTRQWNTLSADFDELLAGMQSAKSRVGLSAAFDASPAEVGRAAAPRSTRKRRERR